MPVEDWWPNLREGMRARLLRALDGVGDPAITWWTEGHAVVHLRRPLTAGEQEMTPSGWCDLPARDLAGGTILLDWR